MPLGEYVFTLIRHCGLWLAGIVWLPYSSSCTPESGGLYYWQIRLQNQGTARGDLVVYCQVFKHLL